MPLNVTRVAADDKPGAFLSPFDFRFRVFCHWFCNHNYFGNVILACILISSAMLAAEEPLSTTTDRNLVCNYRSIAAVIPFSIARHAP